MYTLIWTNLDTMQSHDLDEMMSLATNIINLEMRLNGKLSEETRQLVAPAFVHLELAKQQLLLTLKPFEHANRN
jgi:hypothetical protein